MSENTTRLQATGGNVNYWSHQLFGHVRKYSKIPGKPPIIVQCVKAQQNCRQRGEIEAIEATMCENTRFQASDQLVCIVWDYKKIAGNEGKISVIEATNDLAMSENTTRLPATGRYVNYWSHQIPGHVWKYNKIPGKPPIIVQCVKIQRDCRQRGKIEVTEATMCENTTRFQASDQLVCNVWKYNKIAGKGGNI